MHGNMNYVAHCLLFTIGEKLYQPKLKKKFLNEIRILSQKNYDPSGKNIILYSFGIQSEDWNKFIIHTVILC